MQEGNSLIPDSDEIRLYEEHRERVVISDAIDRLYIVYDLLGELIGEIQDEEIGGLSKDAGLVIISAIENIKKKIPIF